MHPFLCGFGQAKYRWLLAISPLVYGFGACSLSGPSAVEPEAPEADDLKVLFIGSSYLAVNDMPGIFREFAQRAGKRVFIRREVLSGHYLDYFAASAHTEQVIAEQEWDYVLLQGGCQNAAYPDSHADITPNSGYHPVLPALDALKGKIDSNHGGTRTVYMLPWAFEDGMTWVPGQTDTYADMQQKIRDNALLWADSLGLAVAPVGWAWYQVLKDGAPVHHLHTSDWNHPNWRGSYLSAAVVFATVFEESVTDVAYEVGLAPAEARELREVASRTVLDSLALWNIR